MIRSFIRTGYTLSKNMLAPKAKQLLTMAPAARFSQMSNRDPSSGLHTQSTQIAQNVGLSRFLNRTYLFAGTGFMGALGTAWLATKSAMLYTNPMMFALGGFAMTIAGLIGTQMTAPTHTNEIVNGAQVYRTVNSPFRLGLYGLGMAGLGMGSAPLLAYTAMLSPTLIPTCMAITAAIFGGASYVAYSTPAEKMAKIGPILGGSLLGLIGLQLVGLLGYLFVGPNMLSTLLFRADNYLGILLFSGFIAYDTHVAVQSYQAGNADHLGMSVQLLLDVWNIFIRLLQIFGNRD